MGGSSFAMQAQRKRRRLAKEEFLVYYDGCLQDAGEPDSMSAMRDRGSFLFLGCLGLQPGPLFAFSSLCVLSLRCGDEYYEDQMTLVTEWGICWLVQQMAIAKQASIFLY